MSALPRRPIGFGEILDCSFQLYRKDFAAYSSIALLGLLPAKLFWVLAVDALALDASADALLGLGSGPALGAAARGGGLVVLAVLFGLLVDLALAGALGRGARGQELPGWRWCYAQGAKRLHRLAAAGLAVMAVVFLAVVGWSAIVAAGIAVSTPVGVVAVPVALAGGFVVALWLLAGTAVLLPVVALEDSGALRSLRRSFRLARGARWRAAGVIVVVGVMTTLPTVAVAAFSGAWDELVEGSSSAVAATGGEAWLWEAAGLLLAAVTTPLWVACKTALYHDRRVRTEGYDIEVAAGALAN